MWNSQVTREDSSERSPRSQANRLRTSAHSHAKIALKSRQNRFATAGIRVASAEL